MVENLNTFGELHDEADVVLDHEQSEVERVLDRGKRLDEFVGLAFVEPCRGFVEEQEGGAQRERPCDREASLLAVR